MAKHPKTMFNRLVAVQNGAATGQLEQGLYNTKAAHPTTSLATVLENVHLSPSLVDV